MTNLRDTYIIAGLRARLDRAGLRDSIGAWFRGFSARPIVTDVGPINVQMIDEPPRQSYVNAWRDE